MHNMRNRNNHNQHHLPSGHTTRLLIVDDHPMTVKGYIYSLGEIVPQGSVEILEVNSQDAAIQALNESNADFDLVFLDISMPPSKDGKLTSGEDLGKLLRKKQPNIKLMVLTMLNDVFRIKGIINDLKPEGFLLKTEITLEILSTAYYQVLNGNSYFSPEVGRLLKEPIDADIQIDSLDRKILYYISIGEKMKNLPMYIPLSMATIERRKKNLKSVLQLKSGSDRELLEKAREMGFI